METIKLSEIPKAKEHRHSDGKICLVLCENVISITISKLKELGWVLNISEEELKTRYGNEFKLWLQDYYLVYHSSRSVFIDNSWHYCEVIDVVASPQKTINLKTANTFFSATNCASCGGKLKDPGMGPTYKHCPKCEP
jgi:hypothetical protein